MSKVIVGVEPDATDQPALRWAASYAAACHADLVQVAASAPDQANVLARTAEEVGAEAIVVGRPAASAPRWRSGVLRMANASPVPVIVAQGSRPQLGAGPIVVGIDGGAADITAMAWSGDLARRVRVDVHAAVAVDPGGDAYPHPPGATRADEQAETVGAEVRVAAERDERIPSDLQVTVLRGDPEIALAALATAVGAPLVVVGRGGGLLLGKVPARLVHDGALSVALLPTVLPAAWHREHSSQPFPGAPHTSHRWKRIIGWTEEALGWATADRRFEARGRLARLAAEDPEAASWALTADERRKLLDDTELEVRAEYGDLTAEADPHVPAARRPTQRG